MPAYGSAPIQNLSPGYPSVLWNAETVANGAISVAVNLKRNANLPNCASVEISFAATPGAFQIDVEVADTDADKYYVTKASLTSGLNAQFVGRLEVLNLVA